MAERSDIALFAISYDSVSTLARFAAEFGITYDLLADVGSVEIERLGLLNHTIADEVTAWGNELGARHHRIPFPCVFLLDGDGVIVGKKIDRSHRVRSSGTVLLADLTGEELVPSVTAATGGPGLAARAWLTEEAIFPGQRLYAHVRMVVEDGFHLYVPPIATGYTPLRVFIEGSPALSSEAAALPPGRPFRVAGLSEEFVVVDGRVDVRMPFYLSDEVTGDVTLTVVVGYQACTDRECFPPHELRLDLPLGYLPVPKP